MLVNIAVILITLLVAAFFDLKQKTVPGIVLYPLLVIGLLLNLLLIASSTGIMAYIPLIIAGFSLVVMIVAHQKNLLGGADILLITGILLATPKEFVIPEYYIFFGLLTCVVGLVYYAVIKLVAKNLIEFNKTIKFVPCITLGWALTVYVLFGNDIMTALAGLL